MFNLEKQYKEYLKDNEFIEYSVYRKVIELFNKETIRQIIEEAKSINMGHGLGSLHVIELDRPIKKSKRTGRLYTSIDFNKSRIRKQEIIDKGGLPFEVIKDKNGNEIGDNGGEEWLVFNTSDKIYKFYWKRYRVRSSDKTFFPLKRIRRFHLKLVKKNLKDMTRFAHNNQISYNNQIC